MVTPEQCRAARALLAWSQQQLASAARVAIVTVQQFEIGRSQPRRATLDVIRRAFEAAGVEFIDENGGGQGVRLRNRGVPLSRQQSPPDSTRSATAKSPVRIATLWVDGLAHGFLTLQDAVAARNELPADKRRRATIESGGIEYGPSEIDHLYPK